MDILTRRITELAACLPIATLTGIKTTLGPHHHGVAILKYLIESDFKGGIRDPMGLGKTLTFIALIHILKPSPAQGPVLIVTKLSFIKHWEKEFAKYIEEGERPKILVLRKEVRGPYSYGGFPAVQQQETHIDNVEFADAS